MEKSGKKLEKIVYLIQQTLKNTQGTNVYQNHKLVNDSGEKSEFDVVIESVINDFKLVIAIECKDYNKPVAAEKIEAFNSKCARVKAINKKVFISSKGFQSGAKTAAAVFGMDLYTVEDIATDVIFSWFPVNQLGLRYETSNLQITIDQDIYGTTLRYPKDSSVVYFENDDQPKKITDLIHEGIYENKSELWAVNIERFFMVRKNPELPGFLEFNLDFPVNDVYTIDTNGEKVQITNIHVDIKTYLVERPADIQRAVKYQPLGGKAQAHGIKIKISEQETTDIIHTTNGIQIYYNDQKGESHQLTDLGYFDEETGAFRRAITFPNDKEPS